MSSRSANKTQLHLTRLSISLSRYSSSHGLLHRWFVIILIWGVYLTSLSSSRISARLSSLSPSSSAPNFPPKRTMTHARVYYHQRRRLIYLSAKCDGVWAFLSLNFFLYLSPAAALTWWWCGVGTPLAATGKLYRYRRSKYKTSFAHTTRRRGRRHN